MAGQNLANFDAVLKKHYLGTIREQFPQEVLLLNQLNRNTESVVGKEFEIPLHVGRNWGVGARGESETMPSPGAQKYTYTRVPMRYNYATIRVTGPVIAASKTNEGAFVKAVHSEIVGATNDIKANVNRQLYGSGDGVLATCGTTSNAKTVVVDSTTLLEEGMIVDIVDKDSGAAITSGDSVEVLTVASATTFTVGTAVTTSSSHRVVIHGSVASVDSTYTSREMMGLKGIVATTGTVQGIDRSTKAWWKAQSLTNATARDVSRPLMQKIFDESRKKGGKIDLLVTTFGVTNAVAELMFPNQRFVNTKKLSGGFEGLDYNGVPLVPDPMMIESGTIYGLVKKNLEIYELSDLSWMDDDGSILHRGSGDYYDAVLTWYSELGCSNCNQLVKMDKLNEA